MIQATPEIIAAIVAAIMSLIFSYVPYVRDYWATLKPDIQQSVQGILILVVVAVMYAGVCQGWFQVEELVCGNWVRLVTIAFAALFANQTVHRISPFRIKNKNK